MEQVLKHYGSAILALIVILALGGILVAAMSPTGYVTTEFQDAVEGLFASMKAIQSPAGN